jgi:hypothetical protein
MKRIRLRSLASLLTLGAIAGGGLSGCGGASQGGAWDESGDLDPTSGGTRQRVVEMPRGLDGSQWRWVEAHCTEGALDLEARGFAQRLRIEQEGTALVLTYDQVFATEECAQTVVQRVSPPATPGELRVEELTRVAVPSTPACVGQPEQVRPGEVRRAGNRLEVLVQRSNWCRGLEVRMSYEPIAPRLLDDAEVVRRWVAHHTLGDADRVAALFAPTGSLLEPFTETMTGDPYRHDGREAVRGWFVEAFASAPWRAMRVLSMEPGDRPSTMALEWEYMDPRLAQPLRGRTRFTLAAGEIFEAQLELLGAPTLAPAG